MFVSVPFPSKSTGSSSSAQSYARQREYLVVGADDQRHLTYTESVILTKVDLLNLVNTYNNSLPTAAIGIEIYAVGGGGAGVASLATPGATGGMAAGSKTFTAMLDEITGDIAIDVGAGGFDEQDGNATYVALPPSINGAAYGGFAGSRTSMEGRTVWAFACGIYADFADPTATDGRFGAPAGRTGPGCGGRLPGPEDSWSGHQPGGAGNFSSYNPSLGGQEAGEPGTDLNSEIWGGGGGGGASNPDGNGGAGGKGGGGGGVGANGFAGGAGGDGFAQIRLFVERIVQ